MKSKARMTAMIGNLRQAADRTDELAAGLRGLAEFGQTQLSQNCGPQLVSAFEKRMEGLAQQLEQVLPLLTSRPPDQLRPPAQSEESA